MKQIELLYVHCSIKQNERLMKTAQVKELIESGYKVKVYLAPNKDYTKSALKTVLYSGESNRVYPVYFNHVKKYLNPAQIVFIDTFNTVKNWTFRDSVDMNIKYKNLTETEIDIQNRIMYKAIKKAEYLEQL